MKNAIHAAKDNPYFKEIFKGKVPTVEEFVRAVTDIIRTQANREDAYNDSFGNGSKNTIQGLIDERLDEEDSV